MKNYVCCICGKKIEGYGNNPWPIGDSKEKCCDSCNINKVIPARMSYEREHPNIVTQTKEDSVEI